MARRVIPAWPITRRVIRCSDQWHAMSSADLTNDIPCQPLAWPIALNVSHRFDQWNAVSKTVLTKSRSPNSFDLLYARVRLTILQLVRFVSQWPSQQYRSSFLSFCRISRSDQKHILLSPVWPVIFRAISPIWPMIFWVIHRSDQWYSESFTSLTNDIWVIHQSNQWYSVSFTGLTNDIWVIHRSEQCFARLQR